MRNTARETTRYRHIDLAGIQSKRMAAIQAMRPYAWYDANVGGTSDGMPDISGNDRDPIVNGAGSNAALFLPYNDAPQIVLQGTQAVILNGTVPTFAGPYSAVLDMTSANWNSAGVQRKFYSTNGTHGTVLLSIAGGVSLYGSDSAIASSGHPASGRVQWRIRRDGNTSADLSWRTDGVLDPTASGWTVSATGSITDATNFNAFGYSSDVSEGYVHNSAVYDSTNTIRVNFNAALSGQTGYVDSVSGFQWLPTRATAGRKLVVQSPAAYSAESLFLLGTDDFLTVPLNAMPPLTATDTVTAVLVSRQWHSSGAYAFDISDASPDIGKGIKIETAGTTLYAVRGDGSATITPTRAQVLGIRNVFAAVFTPTVVKAILNGGSNVGSAAHTLGNSSPTRNGKVGGLIAGGGNVDMEFRALMLFNREPSVAELDLINAYYKGGL